MKYERLPLRALVLWEIVGLIIGGLILALILFIFNPYTIVWYILVWTLGAAVVLVSFLYLPLLFISISYTITPQEIIVKRGVIFNRTHYMPRDQITFVSVYRNPLTPVLKISSLILTAPGAQVFLLFLPHTRAIELAKELSFEHKFVDL